MSLGFEGDQNIVNIGDTATIRAYLYDVNDQAYTAENLVSVSFTIQHPDGVKEVVSGSIEDDGSAKGTYDNTALIGQYLVVAAFLTVEDGVRSARCDFEVIDPFAPIVVSPTWIIANESWEKFEDCFDANDEGPWLRDMTLNYFNQHKMEKFLDDALLDVNLQHPPTTLDAGFFVHDNGDNTFTASGNLPLLAQGIVLQIIRHLMRSYVEQPNPVGAQIAWHDRRDYLQRWQTVYQIEQQQYMRMVALFKRQFLQLGQNKLLVASKAGRLIPAPLRTRNVGRGYW